MPPRQYVRSLSPLRPIRRGSEIAQAKIGVRSHHPRPIGPCTLKSHPRPITVPSVRHLNHLNDLPAKRRHGAIGNDLRPPSCLTVRGTA